MTADTYFYLFTYYYIFRITHSSRAISRRGLSNKTQKSERMKKAVKKIGKSMVEWYKLYNFAAKFE